MRIWSTSGIGTWTTFVYTLLCSSANVIASFGVEFHQYAEVTQLYIAFNQSDMKSKQCDIEQCSKAAHDLFLWSGLALNPEKTEMLLLGSTVKLRDINCANAVNIACLSRCFSCQLGEESRVTIDFRLTFDKHVNNICQASYFHVRALRHLRGSVC